MTVLTFTVEAAHEILDGIPKDRFDLLWGGDEIPTLEEAHAFSAVWRDAWNGSDFVGVNWPPRRLVQNVEDAIYPDRLGLG